MIPGSILNLGGPDVIVVMVIVMLLFGAKKLPELGRGMGRAMEEFVHAKDELQQEMESAERGSTLMSWKEFWVLLLTALVLAVLLYFSP